MRGSRWRASCAAMSACAKNIGCDAALDPARRPRPVPRVGRTAAPPRTRRPAGDRRGQRRSDRATQGRHVRVVRGAGVRRARGHATAHGGAQCPDATFLPSDPDAYDEASEQVMGLLRDLGHPLEVWGWDEAYLGADVDDPFELAERIRTVVAAETGLSCSVGISDNKQRAKVATGFGKPAGVFALTEDNWMAVMGDRGVDALWGVGPKTAKRLAGLGITTVADLAATDATLLTVDVRADHRSVDPVAGQGRWRHRQSAPSRGYPGRAATSSPSRRISPTAPRWTRPSTNWPARPWPKWSSRAGSSPGSPSRCAPRRSSRAPRSASLPHRPRTRRSIVDTALEVFDQFELDRPVRLLGVRLELAMPQPEPSTVGTDA